MTDRPAPVRPRVYIGADAVQALTPRERARIIAEAFKRGWPFRVMADGSVNVTPPSVTGSTDAFDLVDMRR
jgi:hypothetical protein